MNHPSGDQGRQRHEDSKAIDGDRAEFKNYRIHGGVSWIGQKKITDVSPDYIEIHSIEALPEESSVSNDPSVLLIYRDAKNFVYIESDKELEITIDNSATPNKLEPMRAGTAQTSGVFMSSGSMKQLDVTNKSLDNATIFYVTAE